VTMPAVRMTHPCAPEGEAFLRLLMASGRQPPAMVYREPARTWGRRMAAARAHCGGLARPRNRCVRCGSAVA
jgi:hypothetical protein